MEYVRGKTLEYILRSEELDTERSARLAIDILDALTYAHSNGVVHRDIKPPNILVTTEGRVKIMDFGIAHVVGSDLTRADEVLGSPNYMAPEQLSKGAIDQRADLFGFGVVLYEMLTGKLPFDGDSFAAIAQSILFEEPQLPGSLNPAVSAAMSGLVFRCLSKDPENRFATASDVKSSLLALLEQEGVLPEGRTLGAEESFSGSSTVVTGFDPAAVAPAVTAPGTESSTSTSRSKRLRNVLLAAASLAVTIPFAVLLLRDGPTTAGDGAPPEGAHLVPGDNRGETPGDGDGDGSTEPSEAELYHEASVALERGELEKSKTTLETLLQRNPGFEGAPELLVRVNQRLRGDIDPAQTDPGPDGVEAPAPPSDAELFYGAQLAFEKGQLEESKNRLEALLLRNPGFKGASELVVKVSDGIWTKNLPLAFDANHRLGNCSGLLLFAEWGIQYSSEEHVWDWTFDQIRVMERNGPTVLNIESYEKAVLGLGKPKNYRFELSSPIVDEDWVRYQRLAN